MLPTNVADDGGFRIALYLNIEEKWSPTYDEEGVYQDKNGDTAYIPKGFQVSETVGENTIDEGLVVRDKKQNEWVWIEVPKTEEVYPTAGYEVTDFTEEEYEKIEKDLQTYTKDYRENSNYEDIWYNGCGLEEKDYNERKKSMSKSVYENNGFYIGRYEAGIQGSQEDSNKARTEHVNITETSPEAVSQRDAIPYNYVQCGEAQSLVEKMISAEEEENETRKTNLMFGIQWDLVMKYMEEKGKLSDGTKINKNKLKIDSSDWGNYKNAEFTITRGQYSIYNESLGTLGEWKATDYIKKSENTSVLLATGATNRNCVLNIYDIAGNVFEWTLEQYTADTQKPCGNRGGYYRNTGSFHSSVYRFGDGILDSYGGIGFRPALW